MGGRVQFSGTATSNSRSESVESKIAAYQAKGRTRILPEGKLPPGITQLDAIISVVGEIATNLRTVLEGHIENYGVSSEDDRDFFNDVVSNVNAVLQDPANSSILQGIELPQINQLINLAKSLSTVDKNKKSIPISIPEIKKELTAASESTLIQQRKASTTALSKPSPHYSAEENSNTKAHISRKKQLQPIQIERGETVVNDTELPPLTEVSSDEDANGPINLSLDGWMAGAIGLPLSESIVKDPEALELHGRLQSDPILRTKT